MYDVVEALPQSRRQFDVPCPRTISSIAWNGAVTGSIEPDAGATSVVEARLIGVQYLDWNGRFHNASYVVGNETAPWFFAGTALHRGSTFGTYGIEIDARTPESPAGVQVLARVPNVFGRGRSAEMTYYETPAGAKVFAWHDQLQGSAGTTGAAAPGQPVDSFARSRRLAVAAVAVVASARCRCVRAARPEGRDVLGSSTVEFVPREPRDLPCRDERG